MRFLHTSDWHVGKTLKGHDRLPEQREVLAEIVRIARDQQVDAVLVAGDLYETATPGAEAQQLVVGTLLALRATGAQVIAIAGNHDHAPTLDAYRPLAGAAGITLVGRVRRPADGGVVAFDARARTGRRCGWRRCRSCPSGTRCARPSCSRTRRPRTRPATTPGSAASSPRWPAGSSPDAVNVVMAHLTVTGAALGGGERQAQSIFEYHVPAAAFPADAHYVALGHLHRRQSVPAPCPVHYCGRAAADRLRRGGQHAGGAAGRGESGHAGPGHRRADHLGPPAADPARHARRAVHGATSSRTTCSRWW